VWERHLRGAYQRASNSPLLCRIALRRFALAGGALERTAASTGPCQLGADTRIHVSISEGVMR